MGFQWTERSTRQKWVQLLTPGVGDGQTLCSQGQLGEGDTGPKREVVMTKNMQKCLPLNGLCPDC